MSLNPSMTDTRWVICLCAEWCGLCRDYAQVVAEAARRFPAARFVWLDIEDQAELAGDFDIETFPTLLLADGGSVRFFGPLTPHAETLGRLLQTFERGELPAVPTPEGVAELIGQLAVAPGLWLDGAGG
jgi:thiol-disulfide isomerase/thioredoxin